MDTLEWLLSSVLVAVLASSITYYFSIRVTRKSRLFDARLKLYGEFLGHYQEALGGLDRILQLLDMDLSDKAISSGSGFATKAMLLVAELAYAGDAEVTSYATDPQEFVKRVGRKGEQPFLEELRSRAVMLHSQAILRQFSDLRFMAGQLALVTETGVMSDCIQNVNRVLATGFATMLGNAAARYPEIFKETDFGIQLAQRAKSTEDWTKEVSPVIEAMLVNMQMELQRTL